MASKKEATSKLVDVTVPARAGIALNDIYKAALSSVRDEVPLVSGLVYDVESTNKKGDERVYKVRISWPDGEGDSPQEVGAYIEALNVPTSMPESDPTA